MLSLRYRQSSEPTMELATIFKDRQPAFNFNISISLPVFENLRRAAATTALTAALIMPHSVCCHASVLPHIDPSGAEHELADQAWRIVNEYYLDSSFQDVNWIQERDNIFAAKLRDRKATYKTMRQSLAKLGDRYTRILDPSQMETLRKFDVSGVGLLLTTDTSGALIVATDPATGTAAAESGVKRGDIVVAIDGKNVADVGAFEVAEWMQGPEGSEMRVKFRDRGEAILTRQFVSKQRAVTRVAIVDRPDGKLGYIRLKEFRASGRSEVSDAINQLRNEGAEWLVIDLRGNSGGVFEGALEIAGLFEGNGYAVARVKGRSTEGLHEVYKSRIVTGQPTPMDLGILVDHQSASSSEVLAGGLRDECRAALIGETTYGKGLIQGVFGLSDGGGVVVTVAEYRTPRGEKIDGVGLSPDFSLEYSGLYRMLKVVGIERMDEGSIRFSRDQVQRVVSSCKERINN